jgi:hypothetical protein
MKKMMTPVLLRVLRARLCTLRTKAVSQTGTLEGGMRPNLQRPSRLEPRLEFGASL